MPFLIRDGSLSTALVFVFPFPGIFDVGVIGNGISINNYSDHSVLLYAFHVAFMCETSNINHIVLVVVVLPQEVQHDLTPTQSANGLLSTE